MSRDDLSAFLDDELSAEERAEFEEQLASDPALAAELEELRSITEQVGDLPRIAAPADFAAGIMDVVLPLAAARGAKAMHPESHGASGAKKRAMRRHEERKKQKAGAAAGSGSEGSSQKKKKKKKRSRRDPFAEDPFDALPPPDLEELGEQLTAFVDGELEVGEAERLESLIQREPSVAAEVASLRRVRSQVAELPRLEAPVSLMTNVLDAIDELEREELRASQRAQAAKLTLWRNLTRFAQAACFLLVVGGGMAMTSPEERPFETRVASRRAGGRAAPGAPAQPRKRGWGAKNEQLAAKRIKRALATKADVAKEVAALAPVVEQLGRRSFDARWELVANTDLDQVQLKTRGLVARYTGGRFEEARGEKEVGFVVHVPANQVDDLVLALQRSSEVGVDSTLAESLSTMHTEQDRVTLKNGFVLVGQVQVRGSQVQVLSATGLQHSFPRKAVERIDYASAVRCVQVLIR